ncbi:MULTISPECIES: transketolase family protein [Anaerotruncus]|uniref:transketolase family protein n=1 Tax=Anaerotruncus TaxID=244127 RepID=UPI00082FE82E|nr:MULTISPECIES: transketolase C-terminal domain-containing protein [Anaerotruncus]RGX55206.1 hypothetical protein DWV16_09485 [Anaerotruncus sp. AF02-27]
MPDMVSTRTGFGQGVMALSETCDKILVASADTYRSFALGEYAGKYPDRYFEFGIAEQNMITASAAMASEGYTVFAVGYSPFLSMRAAEQIRTFVAYPNLNVKVVAGLGGLSGDTDGVTHQGTEDLGLMRTIPNLTVVCPADAVAAKAFVKLVAEIDGPVYLRLGRGATPVIYPKDQQFTLGKAVSVRDNGNDLAIIAAGPCVGEAAIAADRLREKGVCAKVLDMHTIKPLDTEALEAAFASCRRVMTVEDGTIYGGLGSAVLEYIAESGIAMESCKRLGMTTFGTAGTLPELLGYFGIDAAGIEKQALAMLK